MTHPTQFAERKRTGLLRHPADRRTLFWSLGLFPIPALALLTNVTHALWLLPIALYLSFCAGVLAHYHVHSPVFRSKGLNRLYSCWLSIFYGVPLFTWIPTHNQNHHKFVNGPKDDTATTKMPTDNALSLIIYPTRSSSWQLPALKKYLQKLRATQSPRRRDPFWQTASLLAAHIVLYGASCARYGWGPGTTGYVALILVPTLFASWSMMAINYIQHVGCEPDSPHNHSRNFVGTRLNWLVFHAGLHTVHHENPATHWSYYPSLHRQRQSEIAPELCEPTITGFLWKRYVLRRRGESSSPIAL